MRNVKRRGRILIWVMVGIALGSVSLVMAEQSPTCQTLAKKFADSPDSLSADALIQFQTCIHTELRNRGVDKVDMQQAPAPAPPSKAFVGPGGVTIPFR
jgi:hypothetical protein